MIGRVLVALAAASLTMGATVLPPSDRVVFAPPDRGPAQHALEDLLVAARSPEAAAVRRAADRLQDLATAPDPARVARAWTALPASVRRALVTYAPAVVGNLEGVPYAERDRANRAVLRSSIRDAERRLQAGVGRGSGLALADRLATLRRIAEALEAPAGGPARSLVTLDATTVERAAIAVGDLQRARYVGYLVPGMYFSVREQIVDWTRTAADVQAEQTAWLARFGDDGRAAVVSWIGYRTPDLLNVVGLGLAEQGALRLTDAVNGLKAQRAGAEPVVSVLAHSYGATAASLALEAHAFTADALVMVGAPGTPAETASQLAVPAGRVYVGQALFDGWATSGFFGGDAAGSAFGAATLGSAGGTDPITGAALTAAVGHNGYFVPGTESLRNVALVGIGRGGEVTGGDTVLAR